MSTYGPETTFDLPSGATAVKDLLDAVEMEYGDECYFHPQQQIPNVVEDAVEQVVSEATHESVDADRFRVHSIDYSSRVTITGSFEPDHDLPESFEEFVTGGQA